jgi:hypothetical protein
MNGMRINNLTFYDCIFNDLGLLMEQPSNLGGTRPQHTAESLCAVNPGLFSGILQRLFCAALEHRSQI